MKYAMPAILIVMLLVGGGTLFYVYYVPGTVQNGQTSQSSTQISSTINQGSPSNLAYDCATPAYLSQYGCDQLPEGYQIPAKLPIGPQAYCSKDTTQSACALLKQTFGNGVCDPNETVWTSPVDCGCTGRSEERRV